MGHSTKWVVLRKLVSINKVEMLLIQETKLELIDISIVNFIWPDSNFDWCFQPSMGSSGGLLMIWDKDCFHFFSSSLSHHVLLSKGKWISHNFDCVMCNIYAPCDLVEKNALWSFLISVIIASSDNLCLASDFNAIRSLTNRRGCIDNDVGVTNFNNFINLGCLFDVPLNGLKFTWFGHGTKKSRLDHFLLGLNWINKFCNLSLRGLNRSNSDHIPLLLNFDSSDWGLRPFKFLNY
ncbi:hypothetical protein REPUB_Repub20aG0089000 [Reevesia pubescens]